MKRTVTRWVPALVAPVLVAVSAIGISVSAHADVNLPEKTPAQILQFVNTNPNIAFSGKVTKVANLGLPPVNLLPNISQSLVNQMKKSLPKGMSDLIPNASLQGNIATVLGLLSGTQQANVFYNGPTMARVQMLDQMSERDFIVNGSDIWYYDATQQTVLHYSVSAADKALETQKLPLDVTSPAALADYFLSQVTPSTTITSDQNSQVAGRGVYQLTFTPKNDGTLVSSVTISIDGVTGVPLSVEVYAAGQSAPAFKIAFDSVTFAAPDASVIAFTPPSGATVEELTDPLTSAAMTNSDHQPTAAEKAAAQDEYQKLNSEGWSAIVEIPATASTAAELASIKSNSYYNDLTSAVSGGRVFRTSLLNVLITDDGRIYAGSVTVQKLLEAASK